MKADAIEAAIRDMAQTLCAREADRPLAILGIRRGGASLAHRLRGHIASRTGTEPPMGMVDITLYRDDGFGPHDWPVIGPTRIDFELRRHTVVLVDDVLYTGRTVRAAIDAVIDYGRPRAIRLAVLVDRGLRELPVRGDAVGLTLETNPDEHVDVSLAPGPSSEDAVVVGPRATGSAP
jgi:pyrimidine operon attenuation protein/uracil phosphoribosyltransferase